MEYSADWPLQNYVSGGLSEAQWSDSALSSIVVNGTTITPAPMQTDLGNITLAPGSKTVTATATPRQSSARLAWTGKTGLIAGWNVMNIKVTSPNGFTTRDYVVRLYVPTAKSKTLTVSFTSTGALTAASNTALTNLANDIKMFQITSIELSASSSSTLRAGRLTKVLDVLKRVGITTIPKTEVSTLLNSKIKKQAQV